MLTLDSGRQAMEDLLVLGPRREGRLRVQPACAAGRRARAWNRREKQGQVKLVGFDLDPVSYQMVKDGKIDGLVVQDPYRMGYEGMNTVLT